MPGRDIPLHGKRMVTADTEGSVRWWDTVTAREQFLEEQPRGSTLQGHRHEIRSVAFTPDGRTLTTASLDNTVKLWDLAGGANRLTLEGREESVSGLAVSSDGKTLAVGEGPSGAVALWDLPSGQRRDTLTGYAKYIESLAFSRDGATLASASLDGTVKLWDVKTRQAHLTIQAGSVNSVAFAPDGRTLATGSSDKTVRL